MAPTDRPAWRTSSYSSNGQSCVEVAPGPSAVRVRDTKDGGLGPVLVLDHRTFQALRTAAGDRRPGEFGTATVAHLTGRSTHAGAELVTQWHVRHDGRILHFTDAEWDAFGAGVRDGEFAFTPGA